jgi:hypothetical protein
MPDQEPVIISSTDPFKVEATPAKFGGVDARAKRPLDMSGKPVSLSDHHEPVSETPGTGQTTAVLPAGQTPCDEDGRVALPESTVATVARTSIPGDEPLADTYALLPDERARAPGEDGPVVQDTLDMRHRERFDDPSRFLRTDTKVRLPSSKPLKRHQAVSTPPGGAPARILMPPASPTPAGIASGSGLPTALAPGPASPGVASTGASTALTRPDGAQLAASLAASSTPAATSGTPEQRRQSFNQRLTQILSDQQQIGEDLSAVEQAAQITRAQIHDPPIDAPPARD